MRVGISTSCAVAIPTVVAAGKPAAAHVVFKRQCAPFILYMAVPNRNKDTGFSSASANPDRLTLGYGLGCSRIVNPLAWKHCNLSHPL